MKIAITGGTDFVGGHFARRALQDGHEVVLLSRAANRQDVGPDDSAQRDPRLQRSERCPGSDGSLCRVRGRAHFAGINREIGRQMFQRIHVEGTRNVVEAAQKAGVRRIALMSFLRARPNCGSPYHESKWAAEEIV